MAARNGALATLTDVTATFGEAGESQGQVAEILEKELPILQDVTWKEGNLITGERTWVRTGKAAAGFRRLNEGTPLSKGTVGSVDEAAAQITSLSQMDRTAAVLGGNPAKARMAFAKPHFEAMNEKFADTLIYGNSFYSDKEFTGIMARYNSLSGPTADYIIDAGGTGTDNRSILVVNWDPEAVTCIYPKGTKAGLLHMDATANLNKAEDGYPIGDLVPDAAGNQYLAYSDYWQWDSGFANKDHRHIVRVANIDFSALIANRSTGADLEMLLVQAVERVKALGPNAAIYMPRPLSAMMRMQAVADTRVGRSLISFETIGGRKIAAFDGVPIRGLDTMNIDEARVV